MKVERTLQITIGGLAVLGTVMLGISQGNLLFPMLMIAAVITAICCTDILGWFYLPRVLANALMIAAAAASLWNFFQSTSQQQLVAISKLLLYVQLILLFQQKNPRIYGHLAVFSLLQVVIASLLNVRFEFGITLILYMVIASFAVTLLYLYREVTRFQLSALEGRADRERAVAAGNAAKTLRARLTRPAQSAVVLPPADLNVVKPGLLSQVAVVSMSTLVFTMVFFFGLPRAGKTGWQSPRFTEKRRTGFTEEINMTNMATIMQSEALVMRVTFKNPKTDQPIVLDGEPYFRGGVLLRYDANARPPKWSNPRGKNANLHSRAQMPPLPRPVTGDTLVREEIILEPTSQPVLFTTFPAFQAEDTPEDARFSKEKRQVVRARDRNGSDYEQFHFAVLTNSIIDGLERDLVPRVQILSRGMTDTTDSSFYPAQDALSLPSLYEEKFAGLIKEAGKTVAGLPAKREVRARALEAYFKKGDFKYSLDFENVSLSRDARRDPLEDFVMVHKTGHCELYACALTLMLRTQGIPARIVVGYKGGELNAMGKFYNVRQSHAHAWTEVYIEREEMPEDMKQQYGNRLKGGWLRLDPTPSIRSNPNAGLLNNSVNYAQKMWDDYVLGLDPIKQQKLYDPWEDAGGFGDFKLSLDLSGLKDGKWFNWQAGLIAMGVGIGLVFLVGGTQFLAKISARLWPRSSRLRSQRKIIRVEFYERLEKMLQQLGLKRRETQTQREFADEVTEALQGRQVGEEVLGLPAALVATFYRLRFGGEQLQRAEAEAIDRDLTRLEAALESSPS